MTHLFAPFYFSSVIIEKISHKLYLKGTFLLSIDPKSQHYESLLPLLMFTTSLFVNKFILALNKFAICSNVDDILESIFS